MPYANISTTLPAADVTTIKNDITAIRALLPFLINLSKQERRTIPKTGTESVGFVQGSLTAAKDHPEILPATFIVTEFDKDVTLFTQLLELLSLLQGLANGVDDTTLAVGSEAKRQALQFYNLLQNAAKTNPGLQPLVDQLGILFRKSQTPTPPPAPPPVPPSP